MTHGNSASAVAERNLNWQIASMDRQLRENEIHLWLLDLNKVFGSDLYNPQDLLGDGEISRSMGIISKHHRQLYLGGRIGLRALMSGYTGIDNQDLAFGYGQRGKPKLMNAVEQGELTFNYTLSMGHALYGIAWNRALGVDLEIFPRKISYEAMAKRILSAEEISSWDTVPESGRNDAMLAAWTRKEAYGKVLGVGIRYNMNHANLFVDLNHHSWQSDVTGLFDRDPQSELENVCGVQLQLPVPGAATLMYDSEIKQPGRLGYSASKIPSQEAVLSAFQN